MIENSEKYLVKDLASIRDLNDLLLWRSQVPKERWDLRGWINRAIQCLNRNPGVTQSCDELSCAV